MYEYISGAVAELDPTHAVLDVAGVGYYLQISLQTFSAVEHCERAKLYVHYAVREDARVLFGFSTREERELFRMLIGVSGVGGNTARMILSTYSLPELQRILATGNAGLLKNVKGLGIKTAQKIIVELSGRMATFSAGGDTAAEASEGVGQEAVAALVMLGFARTAAEKAVRAVQRETPDIRVEELVRMSLKRL